MRRVKRTDRWVYCSVDYGALELCSLAQVCLWLFGESSLADAINQGQDLHVRLGSRILGIDYAEGMARKAAKDPILQAMRQTSKPVNFGLPGFMGPPKLVAVARKDGVRFCELAGITPVDQCHTNAKVTTYYRRTISPTCCECLKLAQKYKGIWYEEWPEMTKYHEVTPKVAEEGDRGIPLESFGTGMLRLEGNPNAVSNHFFQNLAAQGAKRAGYLLAREAYTDRSSVLYNNCRPVVFVHDEVFSEIREEVAHEAALRKAQIMRDAMAEFIPDVKITAEPALCRRWFKGAEAVYDSHKRLRPWWPTDSKKEWTWAPDQDQMRIDRAA